MNYGVGDTVHYRNHLGGNPFPVLVTEKDPDIRNGRSGFVGTAADGTGVWGYDTQISKIDRAPLVKGVQFEHGGMRCVVTAAGHTHIAYDTVPDGDGEPIHRRTTIEAFRNLHAADLIRLVVA